MIPKFRAFLKKYKYMKDVIALDLLNNRAAFETVFRTQTNNYSFVWKKERHFIFMQSTGLKDKNKVEIFQDDLVKYGSSIYHVSYSTGIWWAIKINWPSTSFNTFPASNLTPGEVIGNIHENPELLEDNK